MLMLTKELYKQLSAKESIVNDQYFGHTFRRPRLLEPAPLVGPMLYTCVVRCNRRAQKLAGAFS